MSFILDPNNSDIETVNDKVVGTGTFVFETNMPGGVAWTSGLTVTVDIQSPYPGDEDQWETIHTFTEKGTWRVDLFEGRVYRVTASSKGPWVYQNLVRGRVTK